MTASDDRIELRLSPELLDLLERAAAISGQPLPFFIRTTLSERAQSIVVRRATTVLTRRDFDQLLRIIDSDDEPVPALKAAVQGKNS